MKHNKDFEIGRHDSEEEFVESKDPYEVEESWWWIFQNPLGIILALGLLVILIIGLWFMFQPSSYTPPNASDLIVVKPDKGPYKEMPDPEQNVKVENQDKEIYKRLNRNENVVESTRVVPADTEKPIDLIKENASEVVASEAKEIKKVEKKEAVTLKEAKEPEVEAKVVAKPEVVTQKADVKTEKQKDADDKGMQSLNTGAYVIRVASFRKQETAERELNRLFNVLGSSLSGVGKSIKKITNKAGDVFFVVKIGGFKTLDQAKQIAQALKDKHFDAVIQKAQK